MKVMITVDLIANLESYDAGTTAYESIIERIASKINGIISYNFTVNQTFQKQNTQFGGGYIPLIDISHLK